MIIDSHAYCFEPADSPKGYASAGEHLAIVQQSQARHHQPAFRIRDGVEGPSHVLDSASGALDDLPDVGFRIDKEAGRVLWDFEGETWTKHFYPPNLRNLEFTPESLVGEMEYAGCSGSSCTPTRCSGGTTGTRSSACAGTPGESCRWPASTSAGFTATLTLR